MMMVMLLGWVRQKQKMVNHMYVKRKDSRRGLISMFDCVKHVELVLSK